MSKKIGIIATLLIAFTTASADELPNVQQGASAYDWQSCVDSKTSECLNGCATSEDISCSDNCEQTAKDKCQSEGHSPPETVGE